MEADNGGSATSIDRTKCTTSESRPAEKPHRRTRQEKTKKNGVRTRKSRVSRRGIVSLKAAL